MKKLRIGMVGAGFIADWHYNAFKSLPEVEFVGLTRDFTGTQEEIAVQREALAKKCGEWGIVAYPSFQAMVEDPSLDALIIGSINPYHCDQIVAGLKAGKHLLVEKPVVTDLEELEAIKQLSKSTGRVVFPGHNFVYRGAIQKAKAIVSSGILGQLVSSSFISSHTISDGHANGWRSKKALSKGGALMDSGHHLVYQALYLLGMPTALHAFSSTLVRKNMEGEDSIQVSMQFADGSLGCLMQSWASGMDQGISGIRILGDKGNLIITDALYLNGEKLSDDVQYGDSFAGQARAFVASIRDGIPPVSTLDDVRDTLKFISAAYGNSEQVAHFGSC